MYFYSHFHTVLYIVLYYTIKIFTIPYVLNNINYTTQFYIYIIILYYIIFYKFVLLYIRVYRIVYMV